MDQSVDTPAAVTAADREIVAVFSTAEAFADAVDALQSHGLDRAQLSVLATGSEEQGAALSKAGFRSVSDILAAVEVPRTSYTQPEDVATGKGAIISTFVYVGAILGAGAAVAAGGIGALPLMASAVASGAAGGGVGAFLSHRFGGRHAKYIEQSLRHGGLVLWVLLRADDDGSAISALLTRCGSETTIIQAPPPAGELTYQRYRYESHAAFGRN